jgi:Protein of unknown function (DUF3276)
MSGGNSYRDDVFSTAVKAGKRTYFFDVKATRGNDLFMTITESKRSGNSDEGQPHFEKHKIFLYKEDFDKFLDGMQEAIDHIRQLQESGQYLPMDAHRRPFSNEENAEAHGGSDQVNFEDLG